MKTTPHSFRRMGIHAWILGLLLAIILLASSCNVSRRPKKDPCKERRGMSGYGYGLKDGSNVTQYSIAI